MATETPTKPTKPAKIPPNFHIAIPPPELAQDPALISHLVQLINEAFTIAEAGIFDGNYLRTNSSEIIKYITTGQLALASNSQSSPWISPKNIQGCIRITRHSTTEGELAMLVTSPTSRGTGLGRQLMVFGEEHCRAWGAEKIRLDLLVPTAFRHDLKAWVGLWYERLGYRVMGTSDFREVFPRIAHTVVAETEYRNFVKDL